MSDERQRARSRAKLILKSERALGAGGVFGASGAFAAPDIVPRTDAPAPTSNIAASPLTAPRGDAIEQRTPPQKPSRADQPPVPALDPNQTAPRATLPAPTSFAPDTPLIPFGPNRPAFEGEPLPRARKLELLGALDANEVKGCPKCKLCETRTNTVFGEGDADAPLMFIGEGPGENEDLQGRPFVGKAGQLLDKMINAMGLRREQVFIANVVKCRPPGNRVPAPEEVAACTPYLERQIELIRPRVIVTLGLPASQYMLQTKSSMSRMRGLWHAWRGIKLMPTYHPAYVLRQYTEQTRKAVWSDLQQVMAELGLKGRGAPS